MSIQTTLKKINNLLLQTKTRLKQGNFELPLVKCSREFDFQRQIMVRRNPIPLVFKKSSVSYILRVVEILMIVRSLLLNNKFITKRNLYYQLIKYYQSYMVLDDDLLVICDSLKLERTNLNIIVSNNLQLFWFNSIRLQKNKSIRIELSYNKYLVSEISQENDDKVQNDEQQKEQELKPNFIQKEHILLQPQQIFKLPNCPKIQINILYPQQSISEKETKIKLLIMEKESLFEILSQSLTYKPPSQNCNWLLMHCKGYPDMTALQFINQMLKISQHQDIQFYYIGDYDVYGIDIMLNYSIGTESYKGLWQKLNWLCLFDELIEFQNQLNPGFKIKFQQSEYQKLNNEDKKKIKQILARDYLQIEKIDQIIENQHQNQTKNHTNLLFRNKVINWREILQRLMQNEHQCQVESYFKNWQYPFDLIELMISKRFYIS